jgi:hypothetical protein
MHYPPSVAPRMCEFQVQGGEIRSDLLVKTGVKAVISDDRLGRLKGDSPALHKSLKVPFLKLAS